MRRAWVGKDLQDLNSLSCKFISSIGYLHVVDRRFLAACLEPVPHFPEKEVMVGLVPSEKSKHVHDFQLLGCLLVTSYLCPACHGEANTMSYSMTVFLVASSTLKLANWSQSSSSSGNFPEAWHLQKKILWHEIALLVKIPSNSQLT